MSGNVFVSSFTHFPDPHPPLIIMYQSPPAEMSIPIMEYQPAPRLDGRFITFVEFSGMLARMNALEIENNQLHSDVTVLQSENRKKVDRLSSQNCEINRLQLENDELRRKLGDMERRRIMNNVEIGGNPIENSTAFVENDSSATKVNKDGSGGKQNSQEHGSHQRPNQSFYNGNRSRYGMGGYNGNQSYGRGRGQCYGRGRGQSYGNQDHQRYVTPINNSGGRGVGSSDGGKDGSRGYSRNPVTNERTFEAEELFTLKELNVDLFTIEKEYSLAHCVASDFRMGRGIAVSFRNLFKGISKLLDQKKGVGDVAVLEKDGRFIFYLVTKKFSNGKPTIDSLRNSVKVLRDLCVENKVRKLAIPHIGCGLDGLNWEEVKSVLNEEFKGVEIEILACSYKPNKHGSRKKYAKEETMDCKTKQTSKETGNKRREHQEMDKKEFKITEHNGAYNQRNVRNTSRVKGWRNERHAKGPP